ncbi:MAG: helix-turn-helix domain-containing protein, partial [Gemmatimonadota bacterium]
MSTLIGRQEGQRLELKGRDKLRDSKELALEVVAFLNAEGGDLYIGVREEDGRAVAIEGIEEVDAEIAKLTNSLVDDVEPSPGAEELELTGEASHGGGPVIRVQVNRGSRKPYALKGTKDARRFYTRIGARKRSMTREELAAAFAQVEVEEDVVENAKRRLVSDRDDLQATSEEWFWVGIQPVGDAGLDVQEATFKRYLTDPEAIGVPRDLPSFHVPFEPELKQGRLIARAIPSDRVVKETVLRADGGIRFRSVIHHLYQHARGASPRWINPEVLIGVPLSLFRLAAAVLDGKLEPTDPLAVDVALLGVGREEARLMPGRWRVP